MRPMRLVAKPAANPHRSARPVLRLVKPIKSQVPVILPQARGKAIVNLLQIEPGEKVSAILPIQEFEAGKYIIMATQNAL